MAPGGMMQVADRRFENSDWPISFEVPVEREQADRWTRYLRAECDRRGWAEVVPSSYDRLFE